MSDIDSGADWGASSETVTTAYTESGIPYQTVSTGNDSFYKAEDWLTPGDVLGITNPTDSHYGVQENVDSQDYSVDIDRSLERIETEREQGKLDGINGEIIGTTLRGFQEQFDAPGFDEYLQSDDESFQRVQLPQQLLDTVKQMYEVDADVARAFVAYHNPTVQQLTVFANAIGVDYNPPAAYNKPVEAPEYDGASPTLYNGKPWEQFQQQQYQPEVESDTSAISVQELDSLRSTEFKGASDLQWSNILNQVIDRYEALPANRRQAYDSAEGFKRLFYEGRQQKPQFQSGATKQQARQQIPKGNIPSNAMTNEGKLKQSWINSLSNSAYAKNAEKLDTWIAAGKIDYKA